MSFINISAYRFVTLNNLPKLRVELLQQCQMVGMKGTILLSQEGINIALSGNSAAVAALSDYFNGAACFAGIVFKQSESATQPFRRLQVKIKDEIIRMNAPTIQPEQHTVNHLSPEVFKQWLDEGREVTILDTRNRYEVKVGTFNGAISLNIDHFSEFPAQAANQLAEQRLKQRPLVMFCTGGVRCEKAGPALEQQGFEQVYQLEGGILNYFEQCGDSYWQGECFVFDDRLAVDGRLMPTQQGYCPNCAEPLPEPYRQLPPWQRVKQCHCYRDNSEQMGEDRVM
ncbi:MAG: sulfurtransferase [Gammaproteobacteria bacterium]|nr:sulfurtransferase [Gammaproteobacteria bacterium]